MNVSTDNHPDEELLIAHALEDTGDEVYRHIAACSRCAQIVSETRLLKDKLTALNGTEIPAHLRQQILDTARKKSLSVASLTSFDWINNWYKNPFVVTGIVIAVIVVLFVMFSFWHG